MVIGLGMACIRAATMTRPSNPCCRRPIWTLPIRAATFFCPRPTTVRRARRMRSSSASAAFPNCSRNNATRLLLLRDESCGRESGRRIRASISADRIAAEERRSRSIPSWRRRTCNWEISTRTRRKYAEAIPEYVRARELSPDLADAHYRLAPGLCAHRQKDLAQEEFQMYQRLRAEHLAELDKQRADIRQFVYSAKRWADGEVTG